MITKKWNDYFIKYIFKYGWSMWIGVIYATMGVSVFSLFFWITYVPLILLVNLSKKISLNEIIEDSKTEEVVEKKRMI